MYPMIRIHLVGLMLLILTWSCTTQQRRAETGEQRISLMTYNVENLFDTSKDEGKNDHTYLPLSLKNTPQQRRACRELQRDYWREECLKMDWSDRVLKEKFRRLSHVINQVEKNGPDILVLTEVENEAVLRQFVDGYLKKAKYQTVVLLEGPDERGIDIGVVSRLPLVEGSAKLHPIPFEPIKTESGTQSLDASRGIFEVTLKLPDDELITVFGLHFPSQGSPTPFREQAIKKLNQLYKELPEGRMTIAAGDFNITKEEGDILYNDMLGQVWTISHEVGCKKCPGTYYYSRNDAWSFFDAILFSPELVSGDKGWKLDKESIHTPQASRFQMNRFMSPARFNHNAPAGVSDHLPMYAELVRVKAPSKMDEKKAEASSSGKEETSSEVEDNSDGPQA